MLFNCRTSLTAVLATAICIMHGTAHSAEPVKFINLYVLPYYESSKDAAGSPRVNTSKEHNALLASTKQADIVKARDDISQKNELITPITLAVLAIRLYDVGLRDDAVFWFYVAKDRYATLAAVADMNTSQLAQVADAFKNFASLAGPVINGYAFCDLSKQRKARTKAFQWVTDNPYKAIFLPQIPALSGDRTQNLAAGLAGIQNNISKEQAYLTDAKNIAEIKQARAKNDVDAQFCWN
jgi:hypothetical protein